MNGFSCVLVFLISISASLGYGFSNSYYKITPPPGWHEEPEILGADVIFGGPVKKNNGTPVVSISSTAKALPKTMGLDRVLKISLETKMKKTPGLSGLKIVEEGHLESAVENYWAEFDYLQKGETVRNFFVIYSGEGSFHVLTYSIALKYFNDYFGEVKKSAQSFSLKKN